MGGVVHLLPMTLALRGWRCKASATDRNTTRKRRPTCEPHSGWWRPTCHEPWRWSSWRLSEIASVGVRVESWWHAKPRGWWASGGTAETWWRAEAKSRRWWTTWRRTPKTRRWAPKTWRRRLLWLTESPNAMSLAWRVRPTGWWEATPVVCHGARSVFLSRCRRSNPIRLESKGEIERKKARGGNKTRNKPNPTNQLDTTQTTTNQNQVNSKIYTHRHTHATEQTSCV